MKKVIIEVSGGVAECTQCPEGVEVEIIDHDDLAASCENCGEELGTESIDGKCQGCHIAEARGIK